jgi:hypothetical protein
LPDTTSALLREVAGRGALVRREAAFGIAADNLLTRRQKFGLPFSVVLLTNVIVVPLVLPMPAALIVRWRSRSDGSQLDVGERPVHSQRGAGYSSRL